MTRPDRQAASSFSWRIAGVPVSLVALSGKRLAATLYGGYRVDPPDPPAPNGLRLCVTFAPRFPVSRPSAPVARPFRVTQEGEVITFERFDFCGTLAAAPSGGYDGRFTVTRRTRHAVDSLIRICLSQVLAAQGRLLLHASAVERAGRLHVFSGRSGAGKTTIAGELNGGGIAVAVDRVAVGADGDGRVMGEGTPFSDENGRLSKCAPRTVFGIYFIVQSKRDYLLPLDRHEAGKRLLLEGMPPARDRESDERLLALADRIAGAGICYELGFRKGETYWKLIDRMTQ